MGAWAFMDIGKCMIFWDSKQVRDSNFAGLNYMPQNKIYIS